jgi:hypothetical protein
MMIDSTLLLINVWKDSLEELSHLPKHSKHQAAADCGFAKPRFAFVNPCPCKTTTINIDVVLFEMIIGGKELAFTH